VLLPGEFHAVSDPSDDDDPPSGVRVAAHAAARPITVLMVDDEPLPARTVARLVAAESDVRFHVCSDPTEALRLATRIRPSLILQDVVMPGIDGISMVRAFRARPETQDVPIVVLSSEESGTIKADAFAAGADDYMVKFPDRAELLARIRHQTARFDRRRDYAAAVEALADSRKKLEGERRFLRETFGRYLSDAIVDRLLASPEGLALGGAVRRVTIMMTDLRGFTSLAEQLPPERACALINNYLTVMTDVIVRHGGTIDEFIGDAILALFGAPEGGPDDAARAVACAVEMQLAMVEVNARNRAAGLPEVEMGIGLNTGDVAVGNIGSPKRAKYAVVGSAVNLAARIESYTTGGQVLISQSTLDDAGSSVLVDERLSVSPKGVKEPISIYSVGGVRGRCERRLTRPAADLTAPAVPLRARFALVDGKDAGGAAREGRIVRWSRQAVEIAAPAGAPAFANVKLSIVAPDGRVLAEDLYAKVTAAGTGSFTVRLTSLPPAAAALFEARPQGGTAPPRSRGPARLHSCPPH
jgi:adenylate cyclase